MVPHVLSLDIEDEADTPHDRNLSKPVFISEVQQERFASSLIENYAHKQTRDVERIENIANGIPTAVK